MNFRDTMRTCETCGRNFVYTVEEQRRLYQMGKKDYEPKLCPACRETSEEGVKLIGQVKWYDSLKGYGFIAKADRNEVFVHRTGLAPGVHELLDSQTVEFEMRQSAKGPEAFNVAPLEM